MNKYKLKEVNGKCQKVGATRVKQFQGVCSPTQTLDDQYGLRIETWFIRLSVEKVMQVIN